MAHPDPLLLIALILINLSMPLRAGDPPSKVVPKAASKETAKATLEGDWTLKMFASESGWGVPIRNDSSLAIKDSKLSVKLTVVDIMEKSKETVQHEFGYQLVKDSTQSFIDVTRSADGVVETGLGVYRLLPDELIMRVHFFKADAKPIRPEHVFDMTASDSVRGILFLIATHDQQAKPDADIVDRLRGTWRIRSMFKEGEELGRNPGPMLPLGNWTFLHDVMLDDSMHPLTGVRRVNYYHYETDGKTSPARISIWQPGMGPLGKGEWLSIFKIKDEDALTICSNGKNLDQLGWPTAFESKRNSPNRMLLMLKRVNK